MNRYGQRRCLEACHINMGHHALNRDDGGIISATEWRPCWQMTSLLEYIHKKPRCDPRPDEDTRLECRNVGS